MTLYDKDGQPVAYVEADGNIFSFSGEPVAYLDGDCVWAYSGKHLGWFNAGLVRDHSGDTAFFTENAVGGPPKPLKALKSLKGLKGLKPLKALKELKPLRAMNSIGWSEFSGEAFFHQ